LTEQYAFAIVVPTYLSLSNDCNSLIQKKKLSNSQMALVRVLSAQQPSARLIDTALP
jgi:hypothetical protein